MTDLVLADFDHTITTCDTYARFLRAVATPRQLREAKWRVGPWLAGYRLGLVSAASIRARVTRIAFTGRDAGEIRAAGLRHAREVLPALLRPETMRALQRHVSAGDDVVVVSGSLDVYLRPWCERHGFALLCNRLEARDGVLTGRYEDGDCGARKADLIRQRYRLGDYARIHAHGDSREDRPMLALAHARWYRGRRVP